MPTDFPEITPFEALASLASETAPTLLDLRLPQDQDGMRIPGAIAVAFDDLHRQIALCPNGAIVICHKGLKISAGATARLRAKGMAAHRLAGGHVGWVAQGLPVTSAAAIDRLAIAMEASATEALAAWVTMRFIAPRAELMVVPREDLPAVRERFDAACPATLPDLPGLGLLSEALDCATLALNAASPAALFPMFDIAFRGALRHHSVTPMGHGRSVEVKA